MKKAIIISGSIILAVLVVFFSLFFISITPKDTGKFSVDEFVEYIQNPHFQTDKNYGEIADYKSAAKAGKAAIAERFENSEGGLFEWMGCSVHMMLKAMHIIFGHIRCSRLCLEGHTM